MSNKLSSLSLATKATALRAKCYSEDEICEKLNVSPKKLGKFFNKALVAYERERNLKMAELLAKRRAEDIYTSANNDYDNAIEPEDRSRALGLMLKVHENICSLDGIDKKETKPAGNTVNVGQLNVFSDEQVQAVLDVVGPSLGIRPYRRDADTQGPSGLLIEQQDEDDEKQP